MNAPQWEPPIAAGEHEHLWGMLERLRATFRYKCDGLSISELSYRHGPSRLSLGGLLQHLACVEDEKFTWLIARSKPETLLEFRDSQRDPFDVDAADSRQVYELYDRAVAQSRRIQQGLEAPDALEQLIAEEFDGQRPSVRRIICDLIEEYGRHTGHADLIREAVDGRVGEDPPWDYAPAWFTT
ncbi:mini-circle protein [Glutamicibacter uratoxydans]|uniref:Mini-circle protein n=1 Tax=Glutamicibacter uratoxydans TaxID=43667 RepID=A0A4Y4DTE5_GLUUR|nr:DUF664 domain-containing protein [Glutamicibacter uratoxydans]GED07897.1 mini-circle protein [Glutamicibacter uratoxydans]